MIATLDCIVPKTKQRAPPACHPFAADRDARDGRCPRPRPDATLLATDQFHATLAPSPLTSKGRRNTALPCVTWLVWRPVIVPSESPKAPSLASLPPQLFEIGSQRHRATSPRLGLKCLGSAKVKIRANISIFYLHPGQKGHQARSGQAQGTALPLGRINSFHHSPRPCQPRRLQLRFARGRRYYPPVARTPLSEELPRLVHHRPGHHPNYGPCFQEARLGQDTSLSS